MPIRVVRRTSFVASLLVALPAGALGAQGGRTSTLVAGVADAETGQPLEGAEVILLGVHRLARANVMGEAVVAGEAQGPQRVRVRRLGYAPAEIDLAMSGDTTGAVFRLQRSVTQLSARVEADWMPPKMKEVGTPT